MFGVGGLAHLFRSNCKRYLSEGPGILAAVLNQGNLITLNLKAGSRPSTCAGRAHAVSYRGTRSVVTDPKRCVRSGVSPSITGFVMARRVNLTRHARECLSAQLSIVCRRTDGGRSSGASSFPTASRPRSLCGTHKVRRRNYTNLPACGAEGGGAHLRAAVARRWGPPAGIEPDGRGLCGIEPVRY